MASASREIRRKRRVKRNLTLMTRIAREEGLNRIKVQSVLLAILARHGGEIEITQQTLNDTIKSLGKIQYVVEKKNPDSDPFDGLFVVRLVTTTEPAEVQEATVQAFEPDVPEVEIVDNVVAENVA